jgi:PIN domain nuclease of toxin-antitoxin system
LGKTEVILLDTHVVVWLASEPDKLSKKAAQAIAEARKEGGGLAISALTLYELAHLAARKRIQVDLSLELFLSEIESRFVVRPLNARIAAKAVQLPDTYPNDPIDRIIGATAIVDGLPLVTADGYIQRSRAVKTVW